ncbi:DnaA/Hda family protein [Holospora curviuscula]|uniref:Uncharacterized protein n=1 Tax=Holospora curviuscula TaxID=1082868 RepID=A0A2S5R704_9PROT|nr:DnaA/Hda family protein [Holospora curviuscula]PPE03116.1 hypothetical protein HCUR_01438 [Holospora curviuscula]
MEMRYTHPILPLAWRPLLDDASFCVGKSNIHAFQWVHKEQWPCQHVNIYGPKDSGKTHLGTLWAKKCNAVWLPCPHSSFINSQGRYVLDVNINSLDEIETLSCLEAVQTLNAHCLWLSLRPVHLGNVQPALRSRLMTFLCVEIQEPEDSLLVEVLKKAFRDVGLIACSQILYFLMKRMDRSFSNIRDVVEKIHYYTLKHRANLSIPVVKSALAWKSYPQRIPGE